jgi:hypothetical protein
MGWILPAFFFGLLALYLMIERWPRSPEALFQRRYNRWQDGCRAHCLSSAEQQQEFAFRHAWARLRRRVSGAAITWPEGYHQRLAEIARDEASILAVTDQSVAKRFLAVVEGAAHSEILYPDAMRAVMTANRELLAFGRVDHDCIAAITTAR